MANNNKHTGPNVPALRFPEFSGEWERKALSEFVDRVTRRNKGLKSTRPLTISAQFGLVDQTEFFKKSVAGADLSNYYLLSKGEFAYNKSYSDGYPLGAIKRLDRYDSGVLSSLYICFVPKPYMSSDYLVQYFESTKWNQVVKDISGEGARNHGLLNVPVTGFFETQHYIPKRDEQEKLGAFLTLIEKRIATQSKIIEELTTLRSALLEKVFQVSNPTLEVGAIAHQTSERNKLCRYSNVLSVSNRFGFINQSEQFEDRNVASDDVRNYKVVHRGDFAYNPARINVGSIAMLKSFESGIVSPMYICFQVDDTIVDPSFFELFLETKAFKDEMEIRLEGSVRRCLSFEALCEIHLPRPSLLVQRSISDKIGNISSKIKLEDRILRAYIRQKEWLLTQMFI